MLTNPEQHANYREPGIWQRLAALLDGGCEPRPTPNCGRVECAPGWEWRPRLVDYDLWFAVRGQGSMRIGAHTYAVTPGTLFLLRPGDTGWATQRLDDRLTVIFLHFDFFGPGTPTTLPMDGALLPARCIPFHETVQLEGLLTRTVRLVEARGMLAAVEAKLLLQQALLLAYQQDAANQGMAEARIDRRVEHVMTTVRARPEQRVTLEHAAAMVDLAPGYFSRMFTRETGESFRSFVLRTRLERARFLLEETSLPVGQIAEQLGYSDMFLFSRQFRQHFGYAPSHVRRGER